MADYDDADGVKGQVENDPYCMDKSWQSRNVKEMNTASGYHNMADLANSSTPPTMMKGEKKNPQMSPNMPGENKYDYDKNR
jgi:hypothetical protein